jgi:hypothetical protein
LSLFSRGSLSCLVLHRQCYPPPLPATVNVTPLTFTTHAMLQLIHRNGLYSKHPAERAFVRLAVPSQTGLTWSCEASRWRTSGMYHLECRSVTDEKHSISQGNRLARRERRRMLWRPHHRRIPLMERPHHNAPYLPDGLCVLGDGMMNEKGKEKEKERRIGVDCA